MGSRGQQSQDDNLQRQRNWLEGLLEPPVREDGVLDPWQREAVDQLRQGRHLIVDAVTTSGKTRVVEEYLREQLGNTTFRLIYTSPVKALSNDKYREFKELFGPGAIGLMTGDFKENLLAPVVVATLESYRNTLLGLEPGLAPAIVVFDEYQFLSERERGRAWEEAVILTPDETQLVFLSASVPNVEDFVTWLRRIKRREVAVVQNEIRPVPLHSLVLAGSQFVDKRWLLQQLERSPGRSREQLLGLIGSPRTLQDMLAAAVRSALHPVIVYRGARGDVKRDFDYFRRPNALPNLEEHERQRLETEAGRQERLFVHLPRQLREAILSAGVAYHSSGLNPLGKLFIESLLKQGALRVCFGTMGLSLGINFSVRSVIVADRRRPESGGHWVTYTPAELIQMAGRAGRRGIDRSGFLLQDGLDSFDLWAQHPGACASAFSLSVNSLLNLLGRYQNELQVLDLFQRSFGYRERLGEHTLQSEMHERECNSILETRLDELQARAVDSASDLRRERPQRDRGGGMVRLGGRDLPVRFGREHLVNGLRRQSRLQLLDVKFEPLELDQGFRGKRPFRVFKTEEVWIVARNRREFQTFLRDHVRSEDEPVQLECSDGSRVCRSRTCKVRGRCEVLIRHEGVVLLAHLRRIGAIADQQLSDLGLLASLFPQNGSLLIADRLLEAIKVGPSEQRRILIQFASLCLDYHKGFREELYRRNPLLGGLLTYYPPALFPDYWEQRGRRRAGRPGPPMKAYYREFNPLAPLVVEKFLEKGDQAWTRLRDQFVNPEEYLEEGDLVHFFLKYFDILRSMRRVGDPGLTAVALELYRSLWRPPLCDLVQEL
ncbi:MAG: hypothetical protein A2284_13355 [Deltaproteobacteria bacterium RIFOXYA12_FULL_61_11]|nr:MAG: hypothetical protein A2284_13355 [Deltaproteobacteria bacterium RIFOXYA12_FULL_61_11]